MNNQLLKRITLSFLGVLIISIAVAVYRFVDLGTDPFSCFNLGFANQVGISFGNAQVVVSLLLIGGLVWFGPKFFGVGTVFSMFLVGYVSDFVLSLITMEAGSISVVLRILALVVGVCFSSFGIALYSRANLGISPYDAVSFIIDAKSKGKLPFKYVRIVFDLVLLLIGFLMGGPVGIGTVIIAFGTGPVVAWWIEKVVAPKII